MISTAARVANPQIPDNPTISGKLVPMVYSLHLHGEPSKVPADTTIDAMRGHGRIHTTRGVDYQKTYGVKEGDIAIAQIATQFIGKSAAPPETSSSTRNYEQAWGERANTGNYSKDDIIMVSGSQPRIQQVGAMDNITLRMKANTVQNLQDWYVASEKLGKSETYLNRIHEITDLYIKENISLENAFKAMEQDIKELEKINEMTSLAQSLVKIIGQEDINGIMSVQTEKYQIATKAQDKIYLLKDKNDNILLYVKEGKTQVSNITDETLQDFQLMNFRII
ncbi:MAG: hypothetical protein RMY63_21690 [Nostoc sp. ChiQUE01b]|nr:hypothetical protein [Nostoc sp. ChiQUE01b]MDZ8260986.1 hypothetical protein [Nostoc sp. ChiQUE01b]